MRLTALVDALKQRGHVPIVVQQQISHPVPGAENWQAPLWPGQLTTLARRAAVTPATLGDILAVLGLGRPGAAAAMIGAWSHLIDAIRPDVAVADFAPGLLLAAFGRVPVLDVGSGFSQPPPELDRLPSLTGEPPVEDEAALLDIVNQALEGHGLPPRRSLAGIFACDRRLLLTFAELDPYRSWRTQAYASPHDNVPAASETGDELFAYLHGAGRLPLAFWNGLVRAGLKIRLHDPTLPPADLDQLRGAGIMVEPRRVPLAGIMARSRMILSYGGHGLTAAALVAGVPMILLPFDIEKRFIAGVVEALGLGVVPNVDGAEADAVAERLRAIFADETLTARARAAAPGFRARIIQPASVEMADAVLALARA